MNPSEWDYQHNRCERVGGGRLYLHNHCDLRNILCTVYSWLKGLVLKRGDCKWRTEIKEVSHAYLNVPHVTEHNVPTPSLFILTPTQTANWAFKRQHEEVENELLVRLRFHCFEVHQWHCCAVGSLPSGLLCWLFIDLSSSAENTAMGVKCTTLTLRCQCHPPHPGWNDANSACEIQETAKHLQAQWISTLNSEKLLQTLATDLDSAFWRAWSA